MIGRYPVPGPFLGAGIDLLLIVGGVGLFLALYAFWRWFSCGVARPAPIDRRDLYKYDKLP